MNKKIKTTAGRHTFSSGYFTEYLAEPEPACWHTTSGNHIDLNTKR